MASSLVKFGGEVRVHRCERGDLAKYILGEERIVVGAQQQGRPTDCRKEANRAGPMIVVSRVGESVHGSRDCIIELEERARFREGRRIKEVGIAR